MSSKRTFRAFQAAAPSPTQPSSLFSCARTVMCAYPSVMKNGTENRLVLTFSNPHVRSLFQGKVPHRGRDVNCLTHSPPPTPGNWPRLCTCPCCYVHGENQWRKSPPWFRDSNAPQTSTNSCYALNVYLVHRGHPCRDEVLADDVKYKEVLLVLRNLVKGHRFIYRLTGCRYL